VPAPLGGSRSGRHPHPLAYLRRTHMIKVLTGWTAAKKAEALGIALMVAGALRVAAGLGWISIQ